MPIPQEIKDSLQKGQIDSKITPEVLSYMSALFNNAQDLQNHQDINFKDDTSLSDTIEIMATFDIKMCLHDLKQINLDKTSLRSSIKNRTARVLEQVEIIESYRDSEKVIGISNLARCKKLKSFAMLLNSNLPNLELLNTAFALTPEDDKQQRADILNDIGNTALWLSTICFMSISIKDLDTIKAHPFVGLALKYHNDVDIYKTRYENDATSLIAAAVDAYKKAFWLDLHSSASKAAQTSLQYILEHPVCADDPAVHTINELASQPQPVLLLRSLPKVGSLTVLTELADEEEEKEEDREVQHDSSKNTVFKHS